MRRRDIKSFGGFTAIIMGLLILTCHAELDAASPLDVVINEVAWMGAVASSYDEWFELYNTIDLTNWTLVSDDNSPDFAFNSQDCGDLTIPAQGFLLLERTDDTTVSIDPLAPDSDANWITNDGVDRNGLDANGDPIKGTPKTQNSPFNKPPSNDINVTTDEDTSIDIDLALHCNDPDTDPLIGSSLSDPPHGTAQFLSPTTRYTPDENFSGSDSFTFRVSDGELESNTATG